MQKKLLKILHLSIIIIIKIYVLKLIKDLYFEKIYDNTLISAD